MNLSVRSRRQQKCIPVLFEVVIGSIRNGRSHGPIIVVIVQVIGCIIHHLIVTFFIGSHAQLAFRTDHQGTETYMTRVIHLMLLLLLLLLLLILRILLLVPRLLPEEFIAVLQATGHGPRDRPRGGRSTPPVHQELHLLGFFLLRYVRVIHDLADALPAIVLFFLTHERGPRGDGIGVRHGSKNCTQIMKSSPQKNKTKSNKTRPNELQSIAIPDEMPK